MMLNSEVWHVRTKETKKNNATDELDEFIKYDYEDVPRLVSSHFFNHSVAFTFAGIDTIPEELIKVLDVDNDYYVIRDVPVFEFFDSIFINSFVKKGELTGLNLGGNLFSDNGFAIVPNRNFILKLLKDSYTSLGIDGKRKKIWNSVHYVINLNLNNSNITSGKLHERYYNCLKNSDLRFDVLVSWEPFDASICPSSIASYFYNKSYKVSLCNPKHSIDSKFDPKLVSPFKEDKEDFLIWFGSHLTEVDEVKVRSNESKVKPNLVTHKWTGFFSYRQVLTLWNCIKRFINDHRTDEYWICMYVSGFQNSVEKLNFPHNKVINSNDEYFTVFCNCRSCIIHPAKSIKKNVLNS